jgi:hypothetical protein
MNGCGSLPASARKVPITMRLTPEQEAAYALGYSLSRTDLKPEVQAEYDRLLAKCGAHRSSDANSAPSGHLPGGYRSHSCRPS